MKNEFRMNKIKIKEDLFEVELETVPQYFIFMLVNNKLINTRYFPLEGKDEHFSKVIVPFY